MNKLGGILLCALFLTACAGTGKQGPYLTVGEARSAINTYKGRDINWGGKILSVKNKRLTTEVEIQSFGLKNTGKPRLGGNNSDGRFIAVFKGFRDPAVFATGKRIRVDGIIAGTTERKLDSYRYRYPQVQVRWHKLWDRERQYRNYHHPGIYWGIGWGHHHHHHGWGIGWGGIY